MLIRNAPNRNTGKSSSLRRCDIESKACASFLCICFYYVSYKNPSKTPCFLTKYQDASQQNSRQLHAFAAGPPQPGNLIKYPFVFAAPGQTRGHPKPSFPCKPRLVGTFAPRHQQCLPAQTPALQAQKAAKRALLLSPTADLESPSPRLMKSWSHPPRHLARPKTTQLIGRAHTRPFIE